MDVAKKNILCLASRNARQVTEIQCLLSTEFESMAFFWITRSLKQK